MAFNSHIAIETIKLKIRELHERKKAWAEEAQRLWNAQVEAMATGADAAVMDALEEARLEAVSMATRYREQISCLEQELDAIEAGPDYFRPHRK